MGALLEVIGERNRPESGVMITALVNYLDQNDAGPGFYAYAQSESDSFGRAPPPTNALTCGRRRSELSTITTRAPSSTETQQAKHSPRCMNAPKEALDLALRLMA